MIVQFLFSVVVYWDHNYCIECNYVDAAHVSVWVSVFGGCVIFTTY